MRAGFAGILRGVCRVTALVVVCHGESSLAVHVAALVSRAPMASVPLRRVVMPFAFGRPEESHRNADNPSHAPPPRPRTLALCASCPAVCHYARNVHRGGRFSSRASSYICHACACLASRLQPSGTFSERLPGLRTRPKNVSIARSFARPIAPSHASVAAFANTHMRTLDRKHAHLRPVVVRRTGTAGRSRRSSRRRSGTRTGRCRGRRAA